MNLKPNISKRIEVTETAFLFLLIFRCQPSKTWNFPVIIADNLNLSHSVIKKNNLDIKISLKYNLFSPSDDQLFVVFQINLKRCWFFWKVINLFTGLYLPNNMQATSSILKVSYPFH